MHQPLLRSVRTPSLLIQKPGVERTDYWEILAQGLHPEQLKTAVHALRKARQKAGDIISSPQLKIKDLLDGLADALGGKSFAHWVHQSLPELMRFLDRHGMVHPADLITWEHPPFGQPLTARAIADRLFAPGMPMPATLFTGVGSQLFAARGYGAIDLQAAVARLTGERNFCFRPALEQVRYVLSMPDQLLFVDEPLDDEIDVDSVYASLTLHHLLLLTYRWDIDCCLNLLGDNLVAPARAAPVYQLYNTSADDQERMDLLFQLFRKRIEQSTSGWLDVLPFNENLVFLRGPNGTFDWVVRDQRSTPFSGNKLHPIFFADELPTALPGAREIKAGLHFARGVWRDRIEHDAELHYYATGGTVPAYPGSDQLLVRYLAATRGLAPRKVRSGARHVDFVAHALAAGNLMVSELITIDEFWNFYEDGWADRRGAKAARTARDWPPLDEMNGRDARDRPVCVTWYDAVAYCAWLERITGLPVRMLTTTEWQDIAPARATVTALGPAAQTFAVAAEDPDGNLLLAPTYNQHYFTRFAPDLCWVQNRAGLPFLSSLSFGEWLGDYQGGALDAVRAPVACTASGIALGRGPLERELFPAWYVGRNNHLKVGFRVCYAARQDS
ncbi:MAG: SUMF1/EgtB/PvdO family nonheme iron enzyme [Massilia sp.]